MMTTLRGPTNLEPLAVCYAGRDYELHTVIKEIDLVMCVHVVGQAGIGKTSFVQLLGHYCH